MPFPAIAPPLAWIIVALGVALALVILAIYFGGAMPYISAGLLVLGAPLGIMALYSIYRDIWRSMKKKRSERNGQQDREGNDE